MSLWEITNATARLVLPPGVLILVALVGLALVRARPKYGAGLASFALLSLYALSIPVVGTNLVRWLEVPYVDPAADRSGGAIVVLGGGSYFRAPEYGRDTVSHATLERLRYAAHLQQRIGKPVLVTAGNPARGDSAEARQMQAALREFGVTAKWVEDASNNTFENARFSRQKLKPAGVDKVYLVTHAWHMPRARFAFEEAGLRVIPAPTAFKTTVRLSLLDFIPNAGALQNSWIFFHEIAGLAWYRLRFALGR